MAVGDALSEVSRQCLKTYFYGSAKKRLSQTDARKRSTPSLITVTCTPIIALLTMLHLPQTPDSGT